MSRIGYNNSISWSQRLELFRASIKALTVDSQEKSVFVANENNPIEVVQFSCSTGALQNYLKL